MFCFSSKPSTQLQIPFVAQFASAARIKIIPFFFFSGNGRSCLLPNCNCSFLLSWNSCLLLNWNCVLLPELNSFLLLNWTAFCCLFRVAFSCSSWKIRHNNVYIAFDWHLFQNTFLNYFSYSIKARSRVFEWELIDTIVAYSCLHHSFNIKKQQHFDILVHV